MKQPPESDTMESQLELHGAVTGTCLRASVAFEEAGIPYRVVHVDIARSEHQGAGFLSLNPAGKVPVLVDRSGVSPRILTQSNAIVLYAAEQRPGSLLPIDDARARSIAFERYFYFITDAIAVSHAAFRLKRVGNPTDAVRYLEQDALNAVLAAERFVAEHAFMAGPQFTIADIAAYTFARHVRSDIDWNQVPHLERWFRAVDDRAATQRGMRAFDRQPSH